MKIIAHVDVNFHLIVEHEADPLHSQLELANDLEAAIKEAIRVEIDRNGFKYAIANVKFE